MSSDRPNTALRTALLIVFLCFLLSLAVSSVKVHLGGGQATAPQDPVVIVATGDAPQAP